MIRTGDEYRTGLRDGREIWIDGERVHDVTRHPAFKPVVDRKARMYDMAHDPAWAGIMGYDEHGERFSTLLRPPTEKAHWHEKWRAVDAYLNDIRGILTRVGDETVGEMWSLLDGREMLNQIDPRFGDNIDRHIRRVLQQDIFHVSANTDPKGDRSKRPQDQDPDMMVHVARETDAGIVLRGAKYETAASYADQAFLKPTIASWTDEQLSDYAVGCIIRMGAPGVRHLCRSGFAGRTSAADYPLANRFDEVDTLVILDDVLVPWEDVFFYRHTRAASYIRGTLHRYSAFPYVLRILYTADLMIGAALWNVKQTGLDKLPAVREKLADLVCYREGINAHLIAAVAEAKKSPGGLMMPHQSLLYAGRVHACANLPQMMHIARELCGGQICLTPDAASFAAPGSGEWLEKFYTLDNNWQAEDRRKLLAFARDLLNSDYAGHRLTFVQFAQAPHFNHLNAVYNAFDFSGPLEFVKKAAGLSDRVDHPFGVSALRDEGDAVVAMLLRASRLIDAVNDRVGHAIYWLILVAVIVSAGNASMRYLFSVSSNGWLELQWYLFSAVFLLGAGCTLLHNEHVRIDVIVAHLSPRRRAWIDIFGGILFLLPVAVIIMALGWPVFVESFERNEFSADAGGLLRWPVKLLIPVGFLLLALQGVSETIKRAAFLRGLIADPAEHPLAYAEGSRGRPE